MKILVIQQKMIGDVLVSSVICNNLRKAYPEANIAYLIYPFTAPVVENNPNIDELILFTDEFRQSKKALFTFLRSIRKARYDIVIDAYGKLESQLVVAFSGAKTKIGFAKKYSNFLYTHAIPELTTPKTNAGLAIENRLNLLQPLQLPIALDNEPKIFLSEDEIAQGKAILAKHQLDLAQKIYMIGVLGSGTTKTYPFPYMARVLDAIVAQTGANLLFNYMPSQQAQAQAIFDLCQPSTQQHIHIDLVPGSIREFLAITYHCTALIGNEGGAVNMAKALGKPTFTIFSPWIIKAAWNFFEDGKKHVSVHLQEVKPELYGDKNAKEMKDAAMDLYTQFTPGLWKSDLENYLKIN
jgi:ADP-heptose:LPS heptosyltransferase